LSKYDIAKGLGFSIREQREIAELTQEELAERANVTVFVIRRLEKGATASPPLATLERIAVALGKPVYDLFLHASELERYDAAKETEIKRINYILRRHTAAELKILRTIVRDVFELQRLKNR